MQALISEESQIPLNKTSTKIKSIDGIRAISILMVLIGHSSKMMPALLTNNFFFKYISNGSLGVKIFFVISGYLITRLLINEQERKGTINIKHFYIRRILRIFPVFYLFILVVLILKWFFMPDILTSYYPAILAGTFTWNYQQLIPYHPDVSAKEMIIFAHYWSLAMEEQFYLLWPITFISLSRDKLIKLVCVLVLIMPLIRVTTYFLMPDSRGQLGMMLHTGGDSILTGCLGALLENKILSNKKIINLFNSNYLITFLAFFLFVISSFLGEKFRGAYGLLIGMSLNNLCIILLLLWSIHISSWFSILLNTKLLIQVGILSYSLYIWHTLFVMGNISSWTNQFPISFAITFLVATGSYYLIEKPILKLKGKFKD